MRILFLTNFYPPLSRGGYEQWCQEVTDELRTRGHDIHVLTSRHERDATSQPEAEWIHRTLHLEMPFTSFSNGLLFFVNRTTREKENLAHLRRLIHDLEPDAVLVWGMWNLHRSLPALAEALMPGRVVYYIGDYWPTLPSQHEFYWEAPGRHWTTRGLKKLLGIPARQLLRRQERPPLAFAHALFPTAFLRDELKRKRVVFQKTQIIYGAIDTSLYSYRNRAGAARPLSLLYAGRLTHEKGVHTAIKAVGKLVHKHGIRTINLTIAGSGSAEYDAHLRQLAQKEQVEQLVTFLGPQPKEAMPALYDQADVLLFTSLWHEPFGRVLIEAMASGVVIIGTATGGAAEILIENENALVFPPGDAVTLAAQIARLIETPKLRQRLAQAARESTLDKFDLNRMATEIESYCERWLEI